LRATWRETLHESVQEFAITCRRPHAGAIDFAAMAPTQINGIDELKGLVGETLGPSEWREVTQEMIDGFAEISGDHQWIHVDVERAKKESPFGMPIAHGNLTLATIDGFRDGVMEQKGFKLGVNYGWNKVRFPAPVPVDSKIRASIEVQSVDDVGDGWYQVVQRWTVEAEGGDKPVCVGDSVTRVLA